MKIKKTNLPKNSILVTKNSEFDFVDSYEGEFIDSENKIGATEIGKAFFSGGPKWVETLFSLRNNLVKNLGLKTSENITKREKILEGFNCEKGEKIGLFKVFEKTENEVILGEDDKHLNFRISLFLSHKQPQKKKNKLIISTTVKYNNWFGKLYFLFVKPFHKFIVPTILKGIIINIEN